MCRLTDADVARERERWLAMFGKEPRRTEPVPEPAPPEPLDSVVQRLAREARYAAHLFDSITRS